MQFSHPESLPTKWLDQICIWMFEKSTKQIGIHEDIEGLLECGEGELPKASEVASTLRVASSTNERYHVARIKKT